VDKKENIFGKIWGWFVIVVIAVPSILVTLWMFGASGYALLCTDSERQYSYCEECSRELEESNLISVNGGNGLVCAQCIDEYTKCMICEEYRHNDTMVDASHCENCVDYSIVGYTSQGTPIVDIDSGSIPWTEPTDSDCFSEIAYNEDSEILYVRFRESGSAYRYLDFPESEWDTFISQESLGSWYNKAIKGHYECQKIEE